MRRAIHRAAQPSGRALEGCIALERQPDITDAAGTTPANLRYTLSELSTRPLPGGRRFGIDCGVGIELPILLIGDENSWALQVVAQIIDRNLAQCEHHLFRNEEMLHPPVASHNFILGGASRACRRQRAAFDHRSLRDVKDQLLSLYPPGARVANLPGRAIHLTGMKAEASILPKPVGIVPAAAHTGRGLPDAHQGRD